MISIIDYGAGNLQSVEKALRHIGCDCQVTADPAALLVADAAVLPGVGSFGDAMDQLRARGLEQPIHDFVDSGRPFLGICLGLQILFETSEESPGAQGLGLLGRSPEFKMMLGEMEVASTMHGGFRDAIKWVQPEAMQMLYDYLLDAMTTPPPAKKLFGIL